MPRGMGCSHAHRLMLGAWWIYIMFDTFLWGYFFPCLWRKSRKPRIPFRVFRRQVISRTPKHKTILRSSAWTRVIWLYTSVTRDRDCMFSCGTKRKWYGKTSRLHLDMARPGEGTTDGEVQQKVFYGILVFLSHVMKRCNAPASSRCPDFCA